MSDIIYKGKNLNIIRLVNAYYKRCLINRGIAYRRGFNELCVYPEQEFEGKDGGQSRSYRPLILVLCVVKIAALSQWTLLDWNDNLLS